MMRLALTLAVKDWRLFLADRRAAMLTLVIPILLASGFGLVFDRPHGTEKLPLIVVCERSHTKLLDALKASPRLDVTLMSRADAAIAVADRRPGLAVILPTDSTKLEILHHPLNAGECRWAEAIVAEAMMASLGVTITMPFETTTHTVGGDRFNSYAHAFSGMTLQYLLFWGMESGLLLLRERQRGVWRRLRTAPVPLIAIILGKAISTATLAFLQVLSTFAFGALVFGVPITSLPTFLAFAVLLSVLAAAAGVFVATLGGTEARARSLCILVILGLSVLGGLWLPQFLLPGWARELAVALPTTWAMRGLEAVTWSPRALGPAAAAVTLFSIVFLVVAAWRFAVAERRRQQGWAS